MTDNITKNELDIKIIEKKLEQLKFCQQITNDLLKSIKRLNAGLLNDSKMSPEAIIHSDKTWQALQRAIDQIVNEKQLNYTTQNAINNFYNTARDSNFSADTKEKILKTVITLALAAIFAGVILGLTLSNPLAATLCLGLLIFTGGVILAGIRCFPSEYGLDKHGNGLRFFNPKESRAADTKLQLENLAQLASSSEAQTDFSIN